MPADAVTPLQTTDGDAIPTGGDSVLPDPAEAPDGQVPTTAAGAYELASPSGGAQQLSVLGPFRVNCDDIGTAGFDPEDPLAFNEGGAVSVCPLPDGCIVITAWVEPVTYFGDSPVVNLNLQPIGHPALMSSAIGSWATEFVSDSAPGAYHVFQAGSDPRTIARTVEGAELSVSLAPPNGQVTGAIDVYALIAEPSA